MKKKVITVFVIFGMLLAFSINAIAAEGGKEYSITTPYEFPVKPGDEGWKQFFTTQEMIDACQVPEDVLENTSTAALIETMLSNSFILQFYAYENSCSAMKLLEDNFNIFRELQLRSDYTEVLGQIYEDASVITSDELEMENASERYFDVFNLEVLLAYELYKSENNFERSDIAQTDWSQIGESYEAKNKIRAEENKLYSSYSDGFAWFAANLKEQLGVFSKIPLAGARAIIKTPNQTNVQADLRGEFAGSDISRINSEVDQKYPYAKRIYNASNKYNCHSYAWYSQNVSSNIYWINDPSPFWKDGSYVATSAGTGRKVRYLSGEHSAIMYTYSSGEIYYQSKWGVAGVYRHAPSYGPPYNYGAGVTYYKHN